MSDINLYIYNDVNDPVWADVFCPKCGHKVGEYKGVIIRMVIGSQSPSMRVFKADTAYNRGMCRNCKTRINFIVHSFEQLAVEAPRNML